MSLSTYLYIVIGLLIIGAILATFLNAYVQKIFDFFRSLFYKYINKETFYLKRYTKSLTVYPNNFSIVVNCYDIQVINPDEMKVFSRFLDLIDAPDETVIALPLNEYENIDITKRFEQFGWWWECSASDVVTEVVTRRSNAKKAIFDFKFNTGHIRDSKVKNFKIIFAVSVPSLYKDDIISSTELKYKTDEFIFQVGVDKSMVCETTDFHLIPNGTDDASTVEDKFSKLEKITDNFYTKYRYTEKKPKLQSKYVYNIKLKS